MIEGGSEDNPLNDATPLHAHVDGDPDAFAVLVARHGRARLLPLLIRLKAEADS